MDPLDALRPHLPHLQLPSHPKFPDIPVKLAHRVAEEEFLLYELQSHSRQRWERMPYRPKYSE